MPAATSAPNASTRMISVIGSESSPAFPRSSPYAVSTSFCALASPNSPMKKPRMGLLRGGDAVEDRVDLVDRLVLVAADLELDERGVPVLRDLAGVAGSERRADVLDVGDLRDAARRRRAIAAVKAGSVARSERLWMRTLSPAGCLKPASRILSMRPDSPGPGVFGSMLFVPTMPPSAKATTTKASQPKVAVFQWLALQRPMRAARLGDCVRCFARIMVLVLLRRSFECMPRR